MWFGGKRAKDAAASETSALALSFQLRGYGGHVSVVYEVNRDPRQLGFDLLDVPFDLALAAGYPVIRAAISYGGSGYRAMAGWIQLVTNRDPATGAQETSIDQFPIHGDVDTPFAEFGYAPALFDAPANPDHVTEDWIADTFLAVCPDIARSRRVAALLGFRWGYALRERRPTPLPLAASTAAAWDAHLPLLRQHYPTWEFLPGFAHDL
jgi:hypothetical protein